jgi:hypothetical protein
MGSHFWDIYRDIRSLIQKPDEAVYILYTSIGTITVRRFVYRAEAGYVFLQGIDENGRDRIVGFSEQQLSTFAFEVRTKSTDKSSHIFLSSERQPEELTVTRGRDLAFGWTVLPTQKERHQSPC